MSILNKPGFSNVEIEQFKWPDNYSELCWLSIGELQTWYVAQPMQDMVHLGQDKDFKRFLFWHYTLPVRALRLYYRIKRMFDRG